VKKIQESEYFPLMLESGWRVFVHGWAKNTKGEMKHRVVELTKPEEKNTVE
jgi:hypothetical protein